MRLDDINVYELNEAFASIPMAWPKMMEADTERLSVDGGAITLGHALEASATKLMARPIHAVLRVVRAAFLAPSVTEAILEGRACASLEAQQLLEAAFIPTLWQEQEALLLPG